MENKNVKQLVGCEYPQDKLNPYHYFWKTEDNTFQKAFAYRQEYPKHFERIFQTGEYLINEGNIHYLQETVDGLEIVKPFAITNGQKLLNAFPPSHYCQQISRPLMFVEALLLEIGRKEKIGYYWYLEKAMYIPFVFSKQPQIDEKRHQYFFSPFQVREQGVEGISGFGLGWNYRHDDNQIPYLQSVDRYSKEDIKNYLIDDFISINSQVGRDITKIDMQRSFEEYNFKIQHIDWLLDNLHFTYELDFPEAEAFANLEAVLAFTQSQLNNRLFV